MMQLNFPIRMRCIDARGVEGDLTEGVEYIADFAHGSYYWIQGSGNYWKRRFKPVVRVKAPCIPSLELQVARSIAAVERMTPQQQAAHWAAHWAAQRESWVRGNIGID